MSCTPVNSCVELLQKMVAFNTVNSHISGQRAVEKPLALMLEELARSWGLAAEHLPIHNDDDEFNLLITCEVDAAQPWLMFDSHLDTVTLEGMTIDPLGGDIVDGKIHGRGSCDTKGSGAAMLWALKQYAEQKGQSNNIAVLFSIDEEFGKNGVEGFIEHGLTMLDWIPAGVVVGEPTKLNLITAHNGIARWTVETHGIAAHSSDPSRGQSAISMMACLINAIEDQYIPLLNTSHPMTGQAQCSLNKIRGGTQINIIPESCQLEIDRRVVPGEDPRQAMQHLQRFIDRVCADHPSMRTSHHPIMLDPPLDPDRSSKLTAFIQKVFESMSIPSEPLGVQYGTNASTFSAADIPAVVLGPGHINQAHTHDEWLSLEQLDLAVNVYQKLMSTPLP